jgi:hypothetical protein
MDEPASLTPLPDSPPETEPSVETEQPKKIPVGLIIAAILILATIIIAVVFMLNASTETTAKVRDMFIIFVALESLVIGVALVILIVQLSTLINLLNNEIRPIINSTNDTVNTLKGTAIFLSDNLSEPVIKMNETIAGIRKFFEIIRPGKS